MIFPLLKERQEKLSRIAELEAILRARDQARRHPSVEDQTVLPSAVHQTVPPQQQQQEQGQERQPRGRDEIEDEELSMQISAILADNNPMPFYDLTENNRHVI